MPKRKATTKKSKGGKRKRNSSDASPTSLTNEVGEQEDICKEANKDAPVAIPRCDASELNKTIKENYDLEMPNDFFDFWDFCRSINEKCPKEALQNVLNLELCGPFDSLDGSLEQFLPDDKLNNHLHSRFYYDPPEFMTVIQSTNLDEEEGFHIGYWRDEPSSMPRLVASNKGLKDGKFVVCGDNLFAAVYNRFLDVEKIVKAQNTSIAIKDIIKKLKAAASKGKYSLEAITGGVKKRKKESVVAATFHQIGICVPLGKDELGYRPLTVTDGQLRKMLDQVVKAEDDSKRDAYFDDLYEIVTLIQFANDECDYGMGLEFGLDLFTYGHHIFHKTILNVLPLAYELLGRGLYGEIVRRHLDNRVKKPPKNLST